MPSTLVAGDAWLAVYLWAKLQAGITALVGGQIGLELPNNTPPLPYLSIEYISETPQGGDTLMLNTRLQFSCWAKPSDAAKAGAIKTAVVTAAHNMTPGQQFATPQGVTTLHGANVDQVLWIQDPNDKTARFTVDVIVTSTTAS